MKEQGAKIASDWIWNFFEMHLKDWENQKHVPDI
jgi:hypothetical protein